MLPLGCEEGPEEREVELRPFSNDTAFFSEPLSTTPLRLSFLSFCAFAAATVKFLIVLRCRCQTNAQHIKITQEMTGTMIAVTKMGSEI